MATVSPYLNKIHLRERLVAPWFLYIQNGDDVFVVEISQKLHFPQRPQTEHGVVERRNLLDGDSLTGWFMQCGASCS